MFSLLILLFSLFACVSAAEFPSVIGTFSGMADWYEFTTKPDDSSSLGSDIVNYKQDTRLTFSQQQGPFFRGKEYYADDSYPDGWKFVANLYGIMTEKMSHDSSKTAAYSMRIDEWLNDDTADLDSSIETIGSFAGVLLNDTLTIDYTGGTKSRNKFGAQQMVLKLVQ